MWDLCILVGRNRFFLISVMKKKSSYDLKNKSRLTNE